MSKSKEFIKSLYGRPATVKTKTSIFENHVDPYMHGPIDAMPHKAYMGWVEQDLSLGTVKGCSVVLAEYMKFTYGVTIDKKRLHNMYFGDAIKAPAKLKVWTVQQANDALECVRFVDKELWALMQVALGTGMRRGEIFGLQWDDIDFINNEIVISRSRDISTGAVGPTKTKQSRRIQMSTKVEKIFEMRYNVGDTGFVFPEYFDPTPRLRHLCDLVGLPVITFHDLRHTFATTCLEKGLSPKWVSATLGHAKLSTTLDIYWQQFREKVDMESLYE